MKKIKNIFIILFILLSLDFLFSYLFFKKKEFWKYDKLVNYYWRIPSEIYHHDILANIDVLEPWGFKMKKRLITNSLGFRDFSNKKIQKISEKKRILLIGDSAIEGAGYDYEFTLGGLLQNKFRKTHEILKLAVKRMLPGGPLAKKQLTKLKIYNGEKHPHEIQKPKLIDFKKLNKRNLVKA